MKLWYWHQLKLMEKRIEILKQEIARVNTIICHIITKNSLKYETYEAFAEALAPYQKEVSEYEEELKKLVKNKKKNDCGIHI